jgi:gamma-glutamyltranspeptidase/glutathione hydrolase
MIRCIASLALVLLLLAGSVQAATLPATEAAHGMVVTAQRLASEAGVAMLRQGGNAVDAAVAAAYAEAVVNPCCGNIGGGGFLVAHLADGRDIFLDFRETAPAAATRDMYRAAPPGASRIGWRAVAVPGSVLGLETARREFGRLPRATVMAPAIRLARDGFVLRRFDTDILQHGTALFRRAPNVARVFLHPDGSALQPGERLVQPALAATLQAIADGGPDAFYRGRIPAAVAAAAKAGGGIITAADFAAYRVHVTAPLACLYRGLRFLSAPPPSSGGATLCEILHVLQGYDLHALGFHGAESVHVMVEAERHAFFDRNTTLGDPAFVTNPLQRLLSPEHAAAIRAAIGDRATPSATLGNAGTLGDAGTLGNAGTPAEHRETTQISVLDAAGNAVSVTTTINGGFGAGVIANNTGFLLNDEMDDFTTQPGAPNMFGLVQGEANAIAPGKRPLSSMAPTIVLRDGRVFLVLGSPGGPRIITTTLETALNVIDYGMAPQQAVDAPRLHHQWLPDTIDAEPFALSPDTQHLLATMGYRIREEHPWGAAELIEAVPPGATEPAAAAGHDTAASGTLRPGMMYGANDARRPGGAAIGY